MIKNAIKLRACSQAHKALASFVHYMTSKITALACALKHYG